MENNQKLLQVQIHTDLHAALKMLAAQQGKTLRDYVEGVLLDRAAQDNELARMTLETWRKALSDEQ